MMKVKQIHISIYAIVLLAISLSGCASFQGHELPQIDVTNFKNNSAQYSLDYSIRWQSFGKESAVGIKPFEEIVTETLNETSLFSSYKPGVGNSEIHFDLVMNNHGNLVASLLSGYISGFTLLVIPAYAKDEYTLTAEVSKNDKFIKRYQYDDHMSTWIGWIFLPVMPTHTPNETSKKVMKNMFQTFLMDLQSDDII